MEYGHHLREIAHVGRARAMADLAVVLLTEQSGHVVLEVARHDRIAGHRHVARERLDFDLRAEGQGTGPERAIDLAVGVEDGVHRPPAHVRLEPHLARDHVHLRAAVGDDRMDADRVLVAERLADRVDGHQDDLRRVARVHARVRRARARVALRMARHDQRVQLAEHGERRPVAAPATGVGPHTGQREARPRDQSELLERVLDEPGRLDLLEPELGVAPDLLAQPDDLLAAAVDGLVDPLLQLALGHGVLSVVTRCGRARHSTAASQGAPAYYGGEITRAEGKPWTSTMSSRPPASWR